MSVKGENPDYEFKIKSEMQGMVCPWCQSELLDYDYDSENVTFECKEYLNNVGNQQCPPFTMRTCEECWYFVCNCPPEDY
ncbi:MAG: hypothetical protein V3V41_07960 [Candidatus Heimdallarchaeota archaeon]